MFSKADMDRYASRLYERRGKTVVVPRVEISETKLGRCHENVVTYVATNPGSKRVTGWLIMKIANGPHWFISHSVVKTGTGKLIDITPSGDGQLLPFLADNSSEFFALIDEHLPKLEYWPTSTK
jgi:hypothetical protein